MLFVAPCSSAAPDSCAEVRVFYTFVAIFVKATKRRAQIQTHPILPDRRSLSDRQLSAGCIPSRLALSFRLGLAPHLHQARNLFARTSRWLLLEGPHIFWVLHCSCLDGEAVKG